MQFSKKDVAKLNMCSDLLIDKCVLEDGLKESCWQKNILKGYLRYKAILCHKVALDVQLMNFFI